jgi:septal ring factor EnvC (AmiA/AmiB activator)
MSKTIASDKAAESIATMVTEWVDGGIKMGTDWRPGLASVIQLRMNRVDTQAELAALREELERQKRYVEINANSAHGKHKEGQAYKDERDALREELIESHQREAKLQDMVSDSEQRLADAERRNAVLAKALDSIQFRCESFSNEADGMKKHSVRVMLNIATQALKPTESGASE